MSGGYIRKNNIKFIANINYILLIHVKKQVGLALWNGGSIHCSRKEKNKGD